MARVVLVFLSLWAQAVCFTSAFVPIEDWETFKTTFGKSYHEEEEGLRRQIFHDNLRFVHRHNAQNHSFTVGMNAFADLTGEEFSELFLTKMGDSVRNGSRFLIPSNLRVPAAVDWRKHGYVTPVKDQGTCRSCWSFSATGALEGQHFRQSGKLVSLSEQQLVSCSQAFKNKGCTGGLMDNAFNYIQLFGSESEASYPYVSEHDTNPQCKYDKSKVVADVTGHVDIPKFSEEHLTAALASIGPISVAIDANHQAFQLYRSGVYDNPECSSTVLDHGVLAVGYGTDSDSGKDYYIVKNSWNTYWGDEGYVKMARNKNNQCGIATVASYPLV